MAAATGGCGVFLTVLLSPLDGTAAYLRFDLPLRILLCNDTAGAWTGGERTQPLCGPSRHHPPPGRGGHSSCPARVRWQTQVRAHHEKGEGQVQKTASTAPDADPQEAPFSLCTLADVPTRQRCPQDQLLLLTTLSGTGCSAGGEAREDCVPQQVYYVTVASTSGKMCSSVHAANAPRFL